MEKKDTLESPLGMELMLSGRVEAGCTTHTFSTTRAGRVVEVVFFVISSNRVDRDFLYLEGITGEDILST